MARIGIALTRLACTLLLISCSAPFVFARSGPDPIWRNSFETVDPGPGPTQACPFTPDANGFFNLSSTLSPYTVRLPIGYDVQNPQPQRLLVMLHGCGDSATNFANWAAVPFALRASQNYLAISVGGRDGACWNLATDAALVTAAITHVRSCFYVHQRQIVLGGYSSGGMLAYKIALSDALGYAGVLIENAGLSQAVGAGNVDTLLDASGWAFNIAHSARTEDGSFPIAGVRSDRDKLIAHHYPVSYRELAGMHDGDSADWVDFLIPAMATWHSPVP